MLQIMRCFECIDTKNTMMGNTWMICCKTDFVIGYLASVLCLKRFFPLKQGTLWLGRVLVCFDIYIVMKLQTNMILL